MTYDHITFASVAWNEEPRARRLLRLARRWFSHLVIAVQESTDRTPEIVEALADRPGDRILHHPHYGTGDASMPEVVRSVITPWVFVVAFDEWPSDRLLGSLGEAVQQAERAGIDAYWIPFRSITEGVPAQDTQSRHLRLFSSRLSWPQTMHSRPTGRNEARWRTGSIRHQRSLDELVRDYVRYFHLGRGNEDWERHNVLMMHDACVAVAARHGWEFVTAHEWWPEVRALAFGGEEIP